jgi:hypothetical protein
MTLLIDSLISLSLIANVILFLYLLSWRETAKVLLEQKSELKDLLDKATLRSSLAHNIIDQRDKYIEKLESEREVAPPSKPAQPQSASQVIAGIQDEILRQQTEPNKPVTKYCPDPDSCNYSDCPTAFCDKDKPVSNPPKCDESVFSFIRELRRELAHQTDMASQADIACRLANERLQQLQEVARRLHQRMETWGHVWDREFVAYHSLPPEVKGETK